MFYGQTLPRIEIEVPTALNQQSGPTMQMGQSISAPPMPEAPLIEVSAAASAVHTAAPRTTTQTIQKLSDHEALPASEGVVAAVLPVITLAIKKGGTGIKAMKALTSQAAQDLATCKYRFANLVAKADSDARSAGVLVIMSEIEKDPVVKKRLANIKLQQQRVLLIDKEIRLLARLNSPKAMIMAQTALADAEMALDSSEASFQTFLSTRGAELENMQSGASEFLSDLVCMAKAEGALEFETMEGSDLDSAENQLQSGASSAEDVVRNVEGAAILEQAAQAGVASTGGVVSETPSDAMASQQLKAENGFKIEDLLTKQNLMIAGGALLLYALLK